jgi:hypothetical protein
MELRRSLRDLEMLKPETKLRFQFQPSPWPFLFFITAPPLPDLHFVLGVALTLTLPPQHSRCKVDPGISTERSFVNACDGYITRQQSKKPRTHIDLSVPKGAWQARCRMVPVVYIVVPLYIVGWLDSGLYVNL